MKIVPLLALAGCPYVFGPPDLSNVGGAPDTDAVTDTDTDPDTDTPGTTETDTDTEPTIPGATPQIVSADVAVVWVDHLDISFSVADPDADFVGGTVRLLDGANELQSWEIPADIPGWDAASLNVVSHYVPVPCTGYHPDLKLVMTDFAGHESPARDVPLDVTSVAAPATTMDYTGLVLPSVPATFCSAGNLADPEGKPIEDDYFYFTNPTATDLFVTLDWDPSLLVDIDLFLDDTDGWGQYDPYVVGGSATIGTTGHEELTSKKMGVVGQYFGLLVETYYVNPMSPTPAGPWPYQIIVQQAPVAP